MATPTSRVLLGRRHKNVDGCGRMLALKQRAASPKGARGRGGEAPETKSPPTRASILPHLVSRWRRQPHESSSDVATKTSTGAGECSRSSNEQRARRGLGGEGAKPPKQRARRLERAFSRTSSVGGDANLTSPPRTSPQKRRRVRENARAQATSSEPEGGRGRSPRNTKPPKQKKLGNRHDGQRQRFSLGAFRSSQ